MDLTEDDPQQDGPLNVPEPKDIRSIDTCQIECKGDPVSGLFTNHGQPLMCGKYFYNVGTVATILYIEDKVNISFSPNDSFKIPEAIKTETDVDVHFGTHMAIGEMPLCTRIQTVLQIDDNNFIIRYKINHADFCLTEKMDNVRYYKLVVLLQAAMWFHMTQVTRKTLEVPVVQLIDKEDGSVIFTGWPTAVSFASVMAAILPEVTMERMDYECQVFKNLLVVNTKKRSASDLEFDHE